MQNNQIRRVFMDFFTARAHEVVQSASLIPIDPTLLLTNAGMVPFKAYMLGEETPPYDRAVTIQKVARTVDIDIVGTTKRHLTFFEMLGNFSFGDYFKDKAIPWAYELLTEQFGLDAERLWYTVHLDDDEAAEIWIDGVGVPADRVQRLDHDNFWQMGVPGPAGPSSEIFYDKGPEYGEAGGPAIDDERHVELWNLVFMQFVQDKPYNVVGDLPAKNIDTGAGLERVCTILQGVDSVFETDLIRPVIAAAEVATGLRYGNDERTDVSLRIMGDHGRAATFLIGDGVVPSNEGRGYVLRRLLRRLVRHAWVHGTQTPVTPILVGATIDIMKEGHPELAAKRDLISEMVQREELLFRRTLESGSALLDEELADLGQGAELSGSAAFKLHDTFGFPIDVTQEIVDERGFVLDRPGFDEEMSRQRERARAAFKGGDAAIRQDLYVTLLSGVDHSEFTGYDLHDGTGRILSIIRDGEAVDRADEGDKVEIFVDRTPFYAESGGQVGDQGIVATESGSANVFDTQLAITGIHGHRAKVSDGFLQVGQDASLAIDQARREHTTKNHTGTHLLHWALRNVVGDHVNQAGSHVGPDRLRFDFSHFEGLHDQEIAEIEAAVNIRILENAAVETVEATKAEAERMGALAFFGDKYGDEVRVVKTGDYSTEFCGGTHVRTTGQVGPLLLVSEGSVAANTRRVEALTGQKAYDHLVSLRAKLEDTAGFLKVGPDDVPARVRELADRADQLQDTVDSAAKNRQADKAGELADAAGEMAGVKVVTANVEGAEATALRSIASQVLHRLGSGAVILGANNEGKGALVVALSGDLVKAGLSAGDLIGPGAKLLGGGGSRDHDLAQAGGPRGEDTDSALSAIESALGRGLNEGLGSI